MSRKLSIAQIREDLNSGRHTPSQIVSRCLQRISKLNQRYRAFISVFREEALKTAGDLDNAFDKMSKPPFLFAAPLGIKDNIWVRGHPTTAAVRLFENFIPRNDAKVVRDLRRHQTVILGKNNLHALALGATATVSLFGPVRNPFDTSRIAGGSSGGTAAAVALSMVAAGIGTDTGGSVRIPAALCGLVGFKPTWGRISVHGVVPLSPTLDHVGPITVTVEDSFLIFEGLAGKRPHKPLLEKEVQSLANRPMRVAVAQNYCRQLDEKVERDFYHAIERVEGLGIKTQEVSLSDRDQVHKARNIIMLKEAAIIFRKALSEDPNAFPAGARAALSHGSSIKEAAYVEALSFRAQVASRLLSLFGAFEFIAMPTVLTVAPKLDEVLGKEQGPIRKSLISNTELFNLTGMPAITLPKGGEHGLFTGVQLAARPMDDHRLLYIAHLVEKGQAS